MQRSRSLLYEKNNQITKLDGNNVVEKKKSRGGLRLFFCFTEQPNALYGFVSLDE